jgi:hypothetical protein
MVISTFGLDWFDYDCGDWTRPFLDCLFDEGQTAFFFAMVEADVFFERVFQHWEGDLRPVEAGNCNQQSFSRDELSSLWIALEWVVEREPNMRPWKALPKERIARSGEPIISPVNEGLIPGFSLFMQLVNSSGVKSTFSPRCFRR